MVKAISCCIDLEQFLRHQPTAGTQSSQHAWVDSWEVTASVSIEHEERNLQTDDQMTFLIRCGDDECFYVVHVKRRQLE